MRGRPKALVFWRPELTREEKRRELARLLEETKDWDWVGMQAWARGAIEGFFGMSFGAYRTPSSTLRYIKARETLEIKGYGRKHLKDYRRGFKYGFRRV